MEVRLSVAIAWNQQGFHTSPRRNESEQYDNKVLMRTIFCNNDYQLVNSVLHNKSDMIDFLFL